jgi:glyoxylase-like metal-dependent hydrolase (beta-lactamase superfamily II)
MKFSPAKHLLLLLALVTFGGAIASADTAGKDFNPPSAAPGSLRFAWIYGSIVAKNNRDPRIQVQMYNEDTYIMRQNLAVHWEGSFMYLLFGNDRALLIDTGATASAAYFPLRETVDQVIRRWCDVRGKTDIPLTVVLTSGEDEAQNQGYAQFANRPNTILVPLGFEEMKAFYKFDSWPENLGTIDLGGRIITAVPTPGVFRDSLSFYDQYNDLLHTGHTILPGRIVIANYEVYMDSLRRLLAFNADGHPIKWIMGGHVEMKKTPGSDYTRRWTFKPEQRVLQMNGSLLKEIAGVTQLIDGHRQMMIQPDYIVMNEMGPGERLYGFPVYSPPAAYPLR